ncbi:alpha-E domain-containing protein [Qipengyuania sp. JC766]|uniref:alpha-E domain-containing protein n=1 Tax=Qipengyuania sp. JC766 TaxID=3232139 RepID=UPI00345AA0F9
MLGRTANDLFWMFRYLERAENTARLLDAGLRIAVTRDLATAEEEWRSVIEAFGQRAAYEAKHGTYSGYQAWNFILRDKANPTSVLAMMDKMRTNARSVRSAITGELWEAVNDSWMQVSEALSRPVGQGSIGDVVAMVRRTGTMADGAMMGSLLRDEGFYFARAGTFIERADSIARILDLKYFLLLPSLSYVGSSLDTGQWDNILRSVSGDHAFRWLNAGQIDARGIVEFLVLDERFPRSLAFCHSALRANLAALARIHGAEGHSNALMREADMQMNDRTIEQVFEQGLHEFLLEFLNRNAAIAAAIAEDYRFVS